MNLYIANETFSVSCSSSIPNILLGSHTHFLSHAFSVIFIYLAFLLASSIFFYAFAISATAPRTIYAPSAPTTTSTTAKNMMAFTFSIYLNCCLVFLATKQLRKERQKEEDRNNKTEKRYKEEGASF